MAVMVFQGVMEPLDCLGNQWAKYKMSTRITILSLNYCCCFYCLFVFVLFLMRLTLLCVLFINTILGLPIILLTVHVMVIMSVCLSLGLVRCWRSPGQWWESWSTRTRWKERSSWTDGRSGRYCEWNTYQLIIS